MKNKTEISVEKHQEKVMKKVKALRDNLKKRKKQVKNRMSNTKKLIEY